MLHTQIRVLLVEDHTVVRKGLKALLTRPRFRIDIVGEAADGVEAVALARKLQPDVTVMDLEMPRMGGLEAIGAIIADNPKARILVLTSFSEAPRALQAVRAGALGFLLKDSSPDELVEMIHSVNRGRLSMPAELAQVLWGSEEPESSAPSELLTERERTVLSGVVRGLSNKEIAYELSISPNTVRSHIRNIMAKFEVENRTQAVVYALEHKINLNA